MQKAIFIICILLLQICACKDHVNDQKVLTYYLNDYKDVIGNKIDLNSPLTLYYSPDEKPMKKDGFKIVTFINTMCGDCIKKMDEWNNFISKKDIGVKNICFVAQGKPDSYFQEFVSNTRPDFYIYVDTTGNYLLNQHMEKYLQSTFLLDDNNKVIMIGDPVKSAAIYSFYNKIIHGEIVPE